MPYLTQPRLGESAKPSSAGRLVEDYPAISLTHIYSADSFALFMKNQKQWSSKDLTKESIAGFKSRMDTFGYDYRHVLPHGSYLVNLGNPDKYACCLLSWL